MECVSRDVVRSLTQLSLHLIFESSVDNLRQPDALVDIMIEHCDHDQIVR